ncbi:hypothetical protein DFH08DRAFT_1044633 [Mycena albidolilacea]|uniref:Uncharacterized protein n=1 Tax=Mycena albidolilacea TaxID=1033008 RepID=A0AAD6ZA14_9AGAR|nr:hypothetical protein DFH08DRAFT_1044633 [Mycena albidolilacea]
MLSALFAIALLGLRAQGSAPYVSNDIHCPADLNISFVHNSYTYAAPLAQFTNLTESFFDQSWYDNTVITTTTGTYNVPGATRTGPFAGAIYNETLTMYSKHADALTMSYYGQPFTTVPTAGTPLKFGHYLETLRFESICGGTATYMDVLTYTCSDNPVAVYDVWYTIHMASFAGLAAKVGAPVLAGDCLPWELIFRESEKSKH